MTVLLDIRLPRTLDAWVDELIARPPTGAMVEAWLFEDRAAREAAEARLATAGVQARLFSAYKPLVHHFLEAVDCEGLAHVAVRYPLHAHATPRRFALEAYPLAGMLAGVDFELLPQAAPTARPVYEVELAWRDGRRRSDAVFAPNHVHTDALGDTLLSPTAWRRVRRGGLVLEDAAHESDYQQLFRRAIDCVTRHPWPTTEPYFERLDLRVNLPGIAYAPPEETGWIDTGEALHEDLYFALLEIFQRRSGRPAGDRRLQPGQIVPDVRHSTGDVRLRVSTAPYPELTAPWMPPRAEAMACDVEATGTELARATAPLTFAQIDQAFARIAGTTFEATSRQGRPVRGIYRAGAGAAVLISGGQHANETSGIVGALRAAQVLADRADAHFALIPLENPDGYALHRALCAQAPRHMHHAARYTALGDDLEYRETAPFYEREARQQALAISGADLHINLHGYPAHEWTRPLSGYIPRGFDMWTMPKGFFLIVRYHAGWGDRARLLATQVCRHLATLPALMAFNEKQRASYNAHAGELPFEVIHGTACMISEVNRPGAALTLITEFPDETIYGDPFILAHDTQTATVLAAVDAMGLISPSQ